MNSQERGVENDRALTWSRVYLAVFVIWVITWLIAIAFADGKTNVVADSPREYVELGILAFTAVLLGVSAVRGRLSVGGMCATWGPLSGSAALLGLFVPSALSHVRRGVKGSGKA